MSKEDIVMLQGTVSDVLPNATFKVKMENETECLCHISGKIRKNQIHILLGDLVDVEFSVYDLTKGRIVYRYK